MPVGTRRRVFWKTSWNYGVIWFFYDFGKIITTGEGGIICTNDRKQYLNLKSLRTMATLISQVFTEV